jgi:hypothetical protein
VSWEQGVAREKLIRAVIRRLGSERDDQADAHWGDELDYCDDMILEAARELVAHSNVENPSQTP